MWRRHMSLNKSPPIHRERQLRKKGQVLVALPIYGRAAELTFMVSEVQITSVICHHRYEWQSGRSTLHFGSHLVPG